MCGIAGFSGDANPGLLKAMTDLIRHRGPDADGYHVTHGANLGNRRLRIIDLMGGDQPIANEDESIWIVYNGELYNDAELHHLLVQKGHIYRTHCDTETLLHLYEEYGECFAEHLNGIFAFAIWDSRKQQLLIGRDQFGIKPLHYSVVNGELVFGSEVKALLAYPGIPRQMNPQALHLFLNLRYIPGDQTMFEGIRRLPPGHVLLWKAGQSRLIKYWNPDYQVDYTHDEDYFIDGIRHHLREGVRRQLVSDVPLGLYLSGGMDSSSITAFATQFRTDPVDTFSLGFNEPTDELDDAAFVSNHFQTRHHASTVQAEPLKMLPEVLWYAEEPKENILQGFLLARHARQFVTVALSGLGGDELFAGYQIYHYIQMGERLNAFVPSILQRAVFSPLSNLVYHMQQSMGQLALDHYRRGAQLLLASGDRAQYYSILRNVWDADAAQSKLLYGPKMRQMAFAPVRDVFEPYFGTGSQSKSFMGQTLDAEFHNKMVEDFLNNEDRVSMGNSLEVRVPFLDIDLVRFAFSIPASLKYKNGEGKYIFKRAMQGILPEATLRKKKWGFTFSSYHQFTKDLKQVAERLLTRERIESQGLFNYNYLRKIIDHPPSPRLYWHYFYLWNVVGVTIWQRMFLERHAPAPDFNLETYY